MNLRLTQLTHLALLGLGMTLGSALAADYKMADKVGQGIADFRDEVVAVKAALDGTIKALDDVAVTATTNPRKAYDTFRKSVDKLETEAKRAKKRSDEMKARQADYFKKWESELATVQNPEIRRLATERRTELNQAFAEIKTRMEKLKVAWDPFLSDLRDLRTALGADLSVAGVNSVKVVLNKTQDEGVLVQRNMDALVAELNSIAAAVTPAKAGKK